MRISQRNIRRAVWLQVALFAVAAGCGEPGSTPDPMAEAPGQLVRSDKQRITNPEVTAAGASQLVRDNARFALAVYDQIRGEHDNLFFSPHSISIALAMTYAGARTTTEAEMEETLELRLGQERIHPAFNHLDLELLARNHDGFLLRIVNQLFGRQDAHFETAFLDVLAEHYGAAMRLMDFAGDAEGSRRAINDWVASETEERIEDLLPPLTIDANTRLVLVNAIYFLAEWSLQFQRELTTSGAFHAPGGDVTSPFMHQVNSFDHFAGEGFQAVELPYDGDDMAMLILVPDAPGGLAELEGRLGAELIDAVVSGLTLKSVDLALPRFEFATPLPLRETLQALGMVESFDPYAADFSGISGPEYELYISDVIHKAFIKVDEKGTEAAAATAVVVADLSVAASDVQLTVDRPFIFFIRDRATGAVLFLGRVVNPAG